MPNKLLTRIGESILFTFIGLVCAACFGGIVGGFTALGTDHLLLKNTISRVDALEANLSSSQLEIRQSLVDINTKLFDLTVKLISPISDNVDR